MVVSIATEVFLSEIDLADGYELATGVGDL
jgi:hypothetical protein